MLFEISMETGTRARVHYKL